MTPSTEARRSVVSGRESLSLRECLDRGLFPNRADPERRNVERIADLRDEATHLVVSEIPCEVMCLFQACVINFHGV